MHLGRQGTPPYWFSVSISCNQEWYSSNLAGGVTLLRISISTVGKFLFLPPLGFDLNCWSDSTKSPWSKSNSIQNANSFLDMLATPISKLMSKMCWRPAHRTYRSMTCKPDFSWLSLTCLYDNLMSKPGNPHKKGLCSRCTAFTCWLRFVFCIQIGKTKLQRK